MSALDLGGGMKEEFLRPETISRTRTPKLKTSALAERWPCMRYSGAI